jgi:hypothetical protein
MQNTIASKIGSYPGSNGQLKEDVVEFGIETRYRRRGDRVSQPSVGRSVTIAPGSGLHGSGHVGRRARFFVCGFQDARASRGIRAGKMPA